jgi:hypothetical protein
MSRTRILCALCRSRRRLFAQEAILKTDPVIRERVIRYESKMREIGMRKVAVWVPSKDHAKEIKRIAAGMRSDHEKQHEESIEL